MAVAASPGAGDGGEAGTVGSSPGASASRGEWADGARDGSRVPEGGVVASGMGDEGRAGVVVGARRGGPREAETETEGMEHSPAGRSGSRWNVTTEGGPVGWEGGRTGHSLV